MINALIDLENVPLTILLFVTVLELYLLFKRDFICMKKNQF